jgi:hypothetical protein
MIVWELGDEAVEALLTMPESGMGFQFVAGRVLGKPSTFLVLGSHRAYDLSDLAATADEPLTALLTSPARMFELLRNQPVAVIGSPQPGSFSLFASRILAAVIPTVPASRISLVAGSSLVKNTTVTAKRRFHRYSAFCPDRRVNSVTGDLLPGTYVAPESEMPLVPTGFAAVGRFALPNTQPASYRYEVVAPLGTPVSFGTVAPAYGQAGGGVEAVFPGAVKNQLPAPVAPHHLSDE